MNDVPLITVDQMREVDRLMAGHYNISLTQMMENAGNALSQLSQDYLRNSTILHPKITLLCGAGNNGGGGMVAARHLANRGVDVTILLFSDKSKLKAIPKKQWNILNELPVKQMIKPSSLKLEEAFSNSDIIVDAMIGYGISGPLRGSIQNAVSILSNYSSKIIISLDAPTGFRFNEKNEPSFVVHATATLTLALPKKGMNDSKNREILGDLYLGDISVPPMLYEKMGIPYSDPFKSSNYIRIP
ncbi:MAG: NAD(P)H-hydrate epimerase [Candidatus Marinimicrobia bacterium]|jgi:NAD(P)H-hydrate epimerase|nr:NAD(P)H-hydrate epimerase [Candidatus Neomarinimicrobiota bacterium]MBT4796057.1 NAD(P)H-hydrate epimerase [Candidatus Neomarinimicrobiota bacterium]MBT5338853.1 NAD(P)H-hydrate epimerase [Candidatus Neomarinimicrobiota bacterium]MBT6369197.1 NAD(P)H-hydrate epimerase [Candidatus Neomarinimicrobiota bacterium]